MGNIFEGLAIGVSSGIILSLCFWIKDLVNTRNERRNQIRYLSELLAKYRQMIYDASDFYAHGLNKTCRKDDVRKAYYDYMRKKVQSTLDGRSSRLSFDEIEAVRTVFYTDLFPTVTVTLNEKGYDQIFDKLESFKWLKLPPRVK